jgi:hypothetical protein
VGTQQIVVVVEAVGFRPGPAPTGLSAVVRAAVDGPVAAVLVVRHLPVDIRHRSKVDRTEVARHATRVLQGRTRP